MGVPRDAARSLAYISIFLLIPTGELIVGAFRTASGAFTLSNISRHLPVALPAGVRVLARALGARAPLIGRHRRASWSPTPSCTTACRAGSGPAYISFSGMAANFAGVPLAFAYGATLGSLGVVTTLLKHIGVHIYPSFSLQGLLGASLVYAYFQFPLMILLMVPVIEGLRTEWREAASNLGASSFTFWRYVGLPVVTPVASRAHGAAVRQRLLRLRDSLRARGLEPRHHRHRTARRRQHDPQPPRRLRARHRDDRDHRRHDHRSTAFCSEGRANGSGERSPSPRARSTTAAPRPQPCCPSAHLVLAPRSVRSSSFCRSTRSCSSACRAPCTGQNPFHWYLTVFDDPSFRSSFWLSVQISLETVAASLILLVPDRVLGASAPSRLRVR